MLVGCYSVRWEYVELSGENIEVTDVARPSGGRLGVGKGKIPVRYVLEDPDASLTFAVSSSVDRNIKITPSVSIVAMSTTVGQVIRSSPFEYSVWWWSPGPASRAGETLEIRIELEHRADPIVVKGVIEQWGRFYHPADL